MGIGRQGMALNSEKYGKGRYYEARKDIRPYLAILLCGIRPRLRQERGRAHFGPEKGEKIVRKAKQRRRKQARSRRNQVV